MNEFRRLVLAQADRQAKATTADFQESRDALVAGEILLRAMAALLADDGSVIRRYENSNMEPWWQPDPNDPRTREDRWASGETFFELSAVAISFYGEAATRHGRFVNDEIDTKKIIDLWGFEFDTPDGSHDPSKVRYATLDPADMATPDHYLIFQWSIPGFGMGEIDPPVSRAAVRFWESDAVAFHDMLIARGAWRLSPKDPEPSLQQRLGQLVGEVAQENIEAHRARATKL